MFRNVSTSPSQLLALPTDAVNEGTRPGGRLYECGDAIGVSFIRRGDVVPPFSFNSLARLLKRAFLVALNASGRLCGFVGARVDPGSNTSVFFWWPHVVDQKDEHI